MAWPDSSFTLHLSGGVAEVGLVGGNSSQQRQAVFALLFQGLDYVAFRHWRDVLREFWGVFGWGYGAVAAADFVKDRFSI